MRVKYAFAFIFSPHKALQGTIIHPHRKIQNIIFFWINSQVREDMFGKKGKSKGGKAGAEFADTDKRDLAE